MLRVGIACDFREEGWPSMDLVGDMLLRELAAPGTHGVFAEPVCPSYRHLFAPVPALRERRALRNADRLLNRQWRYPRHLGRRHADFDVFHIVDHSYAHLVHALPARRSVVTCHDLDAFRSVLEPAVEPRSRAYRAMARRLLDGLRAAALVACDTAVIRDELVHRAGVPEARTCVVPLGVAAEYSPLRDPSAEARLELILGAADPGVPELLHVGNTLPRKRIGMLLEIVAAVSRRRPVRLLRVGGGLTAEHRAHAERLGVSECVRVLPFLDRAVLAAVYRRAALLVQPSIGEGFGLPPIEALACGTPVLATDLAVFREVGGDAVSYAPAGDVQGWADLIVARLGERENDAASHQARVAAGFLHAAGFSWARYASDMAALYRTVPVEQ
jgi:glycosyltransferase involved in cell wall biosynthesis